MIRALQPSALTSTSLLLRLRSERCHPGGCFVRFGSTRRVASHARMSPCRQRKKELSLLPKEVREELNCWIEGMSRRLSPPIFPGFKEFVNESGGQFPVEPRLSSQAFQVAEKAFERICLRPSCIKTWPRPSMGLSEQVRVTSKRDSGMWPPMEWTMMGGLTSRVSGGPP